MKNKWRQCSMWKLKPGNIYRINRKIFDLQRADHNLLDTFYYSDLPVFVDFNELKKNFIKHTNISGADVTINGVSVPTKTKNKKPNMFHIICDGEFYDIDEDELIFVDYYDFNFFSGLEEFENASDIEELTQKHNSLLKHEPLLLFFKPKHNKYVFLVTNDVISHWEKQSKVSFFEESQ